jgi:hypothetical protein
MHPAEYTLSSESTQVDCLQVEGKGKKGAKRKKKGIHVGGFTVALFPAVFRTLFRGILAVLEVSTSIFPFSTLFTCQMLKGKKIP